MRALFLVLAMVVIAANVRADGPVCRYQGASISGSGTVYLATSMTVSRNGRCSHALGGTAGGAQIVTMPHNGRLESNPGGLTYTPNPNFVGSDTYVFAGRHAGGRAEVTVSVTVE